MCSPSSWNRVAQADSLRIPNRDRHTGCYTFYLVFHLLEKRLQQAFESHIAVRYGASAQIVVEQPKQAEFGELAIPVAFQLAKQLRQSPKKIAQELVSEIGPIEG